MNKFQHATSVPLSAVICVARKDNFFAPPTKTERGYWNTLFVRSVRPSVRPPNTITYTTLKIFRCRRCAFVEGTN